MVAEQNQPSIRRWVTIGGLMAAMGSGLFFSIDPLLNVALKSQLNLDPNGPIYPQWLVAPIPVTYKFYIMNIENPKQAVKGEKLRVSERGPYTFNQWRRKEIIGWAPDKSTVSYYEYKKYDLDVERTVGSLEDVITTINPLVAGFGATISKLLREDLPMVLSPFIYASINGLFGIHREGLFTTQTVRDLLFGKRVGMLDTITTLLKPLDFFGIKLDQFPKEAIPPNNTVGLLYGKNNTPEGPYEVYTGLAGEGRPFQFASWMGMKKLKFWKTDKCNMINGTAGDLFGPGVKPEDTIYAFGADLCRSISLKYIEPSEYKGIPTNRYSLPDDFLASIDRFPENECFCYHKDQNKCRVDGMYDLGGCQFGAPLIVSTPHFLYFPHLQKLVDGLTPSEEAHGSRVELQPAIGTAIYGVKRLMFALRVENNPRIRAFGDIRNVYVPFVWVEESGGLNDELAATLRNTLIYPVRGASIVSAGVGAAGAALVVGAFARQRLRRNRNSGSSGSYGPNIYGNGNSKKNDEETRISKNGIMNGGNAHVKESVNNRETLENHLSNRLTNENSKSNYYGQALGTAQTVNHNFISNATNVEKSMVNQENFQQKNHAHSVDKDSQNNLPPVEDNGSNVAAEEFAIINTSPKRV